MKVDIITRHAIANYGSILQCYATIRTFEKIGVEAEIIDYIREEESNENLVKTYIKNSKFWNKNFITRVIYKLLQMPNLRKMNNKFENYRKKYLKLTEKQYINKEELINNLPEADIYCTGSDQVWGQIANDDYDENYFLSFVPKNKKCISYAASFGKDNIKDSLKHVLPELMEKYSTILVREDSAVKILNEVCLSKNTKLVLDPTMLLEKEEWESFCLCNKEKKPYILVYQLHHNKNFDIYLKKLQKKTKLKVIRISPSFYFMFKNGKLLYLPTLEEFITYFKNAEYVVTDSFHGTVFSILFNKKMICILPQKTGTRIESVLNLFQIEGRIIKDYNDFSVLNKDIDYQKVNIILNQERLKSINYLKEALKIS